VLPFVNTKGSIICPFNTTEHTLLDSRYINYSQITKSLGVNMSSIRMSAIVRSTKLEINVNV